MTESDAKEKWCPITCAGGWPGDLSGAQKYHKCRASDCMMWQRVVPVSEPGNELYDDGYCGLTR